MAATSIVLTVQRQVDEDEFLDALSEAGAQAIRVERAAGDPDRIIHRFFNFMFLDPGARHPSRAAQGFLCLPIEGHPRGWTHLRLGADERAEHFIGSVARALGGEVHDERTGMKVLHPEPEPAAAFHP